MGNGASPRHRPREGLPDARISFRHVSGAVAVPVSQARTFPFVVSAKVLTNNCADRVGHATMAPPPMSSCEGLRERVYNVGC